MASAQAVMSDMASPGAGPSLAKFDLTASPEKMMLEAEQIQKQKETDPRGKELRAAAEKADTEDIAGMKEATGKMKQLGVDAEAQAANKWDADKEMTKYSTDPIKAFGSAGSLFAILASAFTHQPAINAINGAAAAMNAIKKGDAEGYQKAYDAWKENAETAIRNNELQQNGLKSVFEAYKEDLNVADSTAAKYFAQFDDAIGQRYAAAGRLIELGQLHNSRASLGIQMMEAKAKIEEVNAKLEPYNLYKKAVAQATKDGGGKPPTPQEQAAMFQGIMSGGASGPGGISGDKGQQDASAQHDLLAVAGLSERGFLALTGQSSQLPRDKVTRALAFAEAQQWAEKHDVDISTFGAQYKAQSSVLEKNISRNAQVQTMEGELTGTIQNLKPIAEQVSSGNIRVADVADLFAGKEVNNPTVVQYSFFLNQLKEELAGYNAALQGRMGGGSGGSGGGVRESDYDQAEKTILNGLNPQALRGLESSVEASTQKMKRVMTDTINRAHQQVWDMFGVGEKFKPSDSGFIPNADWPSARGVPNGKILRDGTGNIVARAADGKWVSP